MEKRGGGAHRVMQVVKEWSVDRHRVRHRACYGFAALAATKDSRERSSWLAGNGALFTRELIGA